RVFLIFGFWLLGFDLWPLAFGLWSSIVCLGFLVMPRPCAVVLHVRYYKSSVTKLRKMPRPCAVVLHVRYYKNSVTKLRKMPRPCAVVLHVCSYKREHPRHKAVASFTSTGCFVAASVTYHGARPWHLLLQPAVL